MRTFEKLLLAKKILTNEQIEYYKCVQAKNGEERHLGEILLSEGLIEESLLEELRNIEKNHERKKQNLRKQRKDQKLLDEIVKLGLINSEEIKACKSEVGNEEKYLIELFVEKKYITPYMVRKLWKKKPLKSSTPQDLVIDVTQYQRDRFIGKIAVKNEFVSETQLHECWQKLKEIWPKKSLIDIFIQKGLISKKNAERLLKTMRETIDTQYPFFKYQKNDIKLARKIAKHLFLTPWRLNKCLLKQLNIIRKQKKYVPLPQIIMDDGYLTEYFFNNILKVESITATNIYPIQKEDIPHIIKNAISDVHLILDDDELDDFPLSDSALEPPRKETEEIEEIEEIDEEGLESIANFTKDQLGITASQTLYMNEDDLKIFDDNDEVIYQKKQKPQVNFSLISDEDNDEDFDFVVEDDDIEGI